MNPQYIEHQKIGGTAACILAKGSHFGNTAYTLWLELTGKKLPEDLTWKLPVQVGIATESLNLKWFEHTTGLKVHSESKLLQHPDYEFAVAQVDGFVIENDKHSGIIEAKHTNDRSTMDEQIERYYPQMQHYMAVTNHDRCALSVIFGNGNYQFDWVARDDRFIADLLERESEFWKCVTLDIPPSREVSDEIKPTVDPTKVIDMSGNNEWGAFADDWLKHKDSADSFKKAEKQLRSLVPDEAREAFGHNVRVVRDRAGRKHIRAT